MAHMMKVFATAACLMAAANGFAAEQIAKVEGKVAAQAPVAAPEAAADKLESGVSEVKVEKVAAGEVIASATATVSGSVATTTDGGMGTGEKLEDYMKDAAQPTTDGGDKVMGSGGASVGTPAGATEAPMPPVDGDDMMGSDTPGVPDSEAPAGR